MKFDSKLMYSDLEWFGESYNYPVYISLLDKSSFFCSNTKPHAGFTAISDSGNLLIVHYSLLGMLGASKPEYLSFPLLSLNKLKISKFPFLNGSTIKLEFLVNGKKYRYTISMPGKVANTDLYEQEQNYYGFLDTLRNVNV